MHEVVDSQFDFITTLLLSYCTKGSHIMLFILLLQLHKFPCTDNETHPTGFPNPFVTSQGVMLLQWDNI